MTRRLLSGALAIGALFLTFSLTSCTTIESRIAENQDAFHRLSPADQAAVQQGKIREGLPQFAVYIAWGPPSGRIPGRFKGSIVETWVYDATAAGDYPGPFFYGSSFGYGLGYGYWGGSRRGFRRHGFYDPWFDPFFYSHANIIRYPERLVSFQNGRVIGFQFLPSPRFL